MADFFSQILNMSLTGTIVILVVIAVRACMRKLPKIFSYALWSVVLFRLLCPVSLSAPGSLLELLKPRVQETTDTMSVVSYLPEPEAMPDLQYIPSELSGEQQAVAPDANREMLIKSVCAGIWISVFGMLVLYGVIQYLKLRRSLIGAIRFQSNIYLADHIDTAFVMGILFPRIYLPSHVAGQERVFILAHERCHIRRGDHVIKILAYLALCIHWFNPLVWLSFVLAGKDMEMSCDEAVIRRFGSGIRAEYSASLLRLAAHRKIVPGMPLAFWDGDTKGRIINMAKWKKPRIWVSILCCILCISILAACAINPRQTSADPSAQDNNESVGSAYMETIPQPEEKTVNILLTILPEDEGAAKLGNSMLLLKLDAANNAVTIQSIPGDKVVDIPDYQGHTTGYQPVQVCYALGYVWGDRTGAMEMTNLCLLESFGTPVDYNAELTWAQVNSLVDSLGGVRIAMEESESVALADLEEPVLTDVKPGIVKMDGATAVSYAYPQSREEDPSVAERSRYRQRKLLAAVLYAIRENMQDTILHPILYNSENLNDQSVQWHEILNYLDAHTSFYLVGMQSEKENELYADTEVDIASDGEILQYGALKLQMPQGYTSYAQGNTVILSKYGTDVGGIRCYNAPDVPFTYSIAYLRAMGLPEAQETDEPIAYMIGNDIAGGIEAEFFHELKTETLNVEHHIYLVGDLVYDLYYDQNLISDVQADRFLKTVELEGEVLYPAQPETEESLILCKNLVDLVRAGAYQVSVERKNQGEYALNGSSSTVYTVLKEDWVSITHVPDDGSYHGYMNVNGSAYSNEGTAWEEDGSVNWSEDPYPDEVYVPWIASFQWDGELVSYIDTIYEDGKKVVMLRIDESFPGYENLTECYFVNVHFTDDGSFLYAKIEIDFIWENEVSSVNITESIITLDEPTVKTYLENEYTRASSEN